ncbi:MAG: hypothetical protein HXX20_16115 [Chloroflexi bacterium]|nr:hypothetical protein [Chloroflexota bacterium]
MSNRKIKREKKGCEKEGCKNWAMHDSTFCRVHRPDLPPSHHNIKCACAKEGCKNWAMHDSTFCRVHNPNLPPTNPQTGDNGKERWFQPGNEIGNRFQPGNKIGFQPENQLARKHGFYAKFMTEEEENFVQEELEQPQEIGFNEIIVLAKLGVSRALKSNEAEPLRHMVTLLTKIKELQIKASQNEGNDLIAALDKALIDAGLGG